MCLLLGNQNAAATRHRRERGAGQYLCGRTSFTQAASGCSSLAGSITLNSSPADCSAQLSMAPQKTIHAQGQARTQGISQRNNFFNELLHPSQQPSFNTSLFFLKRSLFEVLLCSSAIYSLISQCVRRDTHTGNSTKPICFPVPSSSGITAGKSLHGELLSSCFSQGHSNFRQMQRNSCLFTILT